MGAARGYNPPPLRGDAEHPVSGREAQGPPPLSRKGRREKNLRSLRARFASRQQGRQGIGIGETMVAADFDQGLGWETARSLQLLAEAEWDDVVRPRVQKRGVWLCGPGCTPALP